MKANELINKVETYTDSLGQEVEQTTNKCDCPDCTNVQPVKHEHNISGWSLKINECGKKVVTIHSL